MTPELRKEASELLLHKRGVRFNPQLPVIEDDGEIRLRSEIEVIHRLQALAYCINNKGGEVTHLSPLIFSQNEVDFLRFKSEIIKSDSTFAIRFMGHASYALPTHSPEQEFQECCWHAFSFLAWASCLVEKIDLSKKGVDATQLQSLIQHMAQCHESHVNIQLRKKTKLLDWADLLYRLHWAVRHAHLQKLAMPGAVNALHIFAWHKTINWLIAYEGEDNWDQVSTET